MMAMLLTSKYTKIFLLTGVIYCLMYTIVYRITQGIPSIQNTILLDKTESEIPESIVDAINDNHGAENASSQKESKMPKKTSIKINNLLIKRNFIINPKDICARPVFAIIIVCSAIRQFEERQAIRETWGNKTILHLDFNNSKVLFLIGNARQEQEPIEAQSAIVDESNTYGDIVQFDFPDTYDNLPTKTSHLLQWVDVYCKKSSYIVKADSDIYLNMFNLYTFLVEWKQSNFIMGNVNKKSRPIRDKNAKYFISRTEYPGKYYPDYASGTCYVISRDSIHRLYAATRRTKGFRMEDIYITGICRLKAGVHLIHHPGFVYWRESGGMCIRKSQVTAHYFSMEMLYKLWSMTDKKTWQCRGYDM